MIIKLINYIKKLIPEATYGQIQDSPDNLININIYIPDMNMYFNDTSTQNFIINLYIRNSKFEELMKINENISQKLVNSYDKNIGDLHLVNTKKTNEREVQRDNKNRYSQSSSFKMTIEY